MKKNKYQQCLLVKGKRATVSWIPSKFADKGKILRIKKGGVWEDGWMVLTNYGKKVDEDMLNFLENQYRDTRETSDV